MSQQTPSTSKYSSFDPCRLFSPIPSVISPLVHNHRHAKISDTRATPLKRESDHFLTSASVSLFETPAKDGVRNDDTMSCSQELFGSPEMFTPAQHTINHLERAGVITDGHLTHTCKQVTHVLPSQNSEAVTNLEQQTPMLLKNFCGEPHLLPHSTPLSSVTQPGSTCNMPHSTSTTQSKSSVPSTPLSTPIALCSAAQPRSNCHPPALQATDQTPEVPVMCAKEPSPVIHSEQPLGHSKSKSAVHVAQKERETLAKEKKIKLSQQNYSFGSVGDVMDMLFMSSSQLDAHLNTHKITVCPSAAAVTESSEPLNENESVCCKQTIVPSSVPHSPSHSLEEHNIHVCEDGESNQKQVDTVEDGALLVAVSPIEKCKTANNIDTKTVTEESLMPDLSTYQPPTVKRKGLQSKANAFHYPTKLRINLKRKKTNIRTREFNTLAPQTSDLAPGVLPASRAVNDIGVEDCEPLAKRARTCIHGEEYDPVIPKDGEDQVSQHKHVEDDVTKVDESMIEVDPCTEMEESPLNERGSVNESSPQHQGGNITQASCNVLIEQAQKQCEDVNETERGNNGLLSSEKPSISVRAPGLRNTKKGSVIADGEHIPEQREPDECPSTIDVPSEDQPPSVSIVKKSALSLSDKVPPFLGFQTAAGRSIAVSEEALKKAQQLIGAELELEENGPTEPTETTASPKFTLVGRSATFKTPSTSPTTSTETLNLAVAPKSNPTTTFVTPAPSRPESVPLTSLSTLPRRPSRRPAKSFKAPRKAGDVSSEEEQVSVSRILQSFRASGAATEPPPCKSTRSRIHRQPIESGFHTAGGLKLMISSEAMEKAQKLLAEDKESGIAVNVSSPYLDCNRRTDHKVTSLKTPSTRALVVSSSSVAQAQQLTRNTEEREETSTPAQFKIPSSSNDRVSVGFQMASGRTLSVSAKSLSKAESLLSSNLESGLKDPIHPESNLKSHDSVLTGFQTAGGVDISVSSKSLTSAKALVGEEDSLHCFDDIKTSLFQSPHHDLKEGRADNDIFVTGLSTDKGTSISVSKELLRKSERLIEREEHETTLEFDDCATECIKSGDSPCSLTAEDVETLSTFTQIDFQNHNLRSPDRTDLPPHSPTDTTQTPGGPSTHNMESNLNEHCDNEGAEEDDYESDGNSCFFSTQVVKQLTDFSSEEEMSCEETSTSNCLDTVCDDIERNDGLGGGVDETAKAVEQSSEAVHLQGQLDDGVVVQHSDGDMADLCSESWPSPALLEAGDDHQSRAETTLVVNLSGEEVTESMMENMEVSIDVSDIQQMDQEQTEHNESEQLVTTNVCVVNDISVIQADQCTSPARTEILQSDVPAQDQSPAVHPQPSLTPLQFPGLQTASGKQVHISESALKVTKQTLGSSNTEPVPPLTHNDEYSFFHTASGKLVHISESSLAAIRGSLDKGSEGSKLTSICQQKRRPEFSGLQTVSEKKMEVSKGALLTAKEVLGVSGGQSCDLVAVSCDSPTPHPVGLTTAGGRKVQISDEALAAVRSSSRTPCMSAGLQTVSHDSPMPHPIGLTTAGGRKVQISDEALAAVKSSSTTSCASTALQTTSGKKNSDESMRAAKLLLDSDPIASSSNHGSSGFPAGGKKVAISQLSIEAARATLSEGTDTCTHNPSYSDRFSGLQTASGSNVTISKDSLQAARAVLGSTSTSTNLSVDVPTVSIQSPSLSVSSRQLTETTLMAQHSASSSIPTTTQLSDLPGAPTRKYKPIFKSGGAKGGRMQSYASLGVQNITTNPSISVNSGGQQLPQSRRASSTVLSTPEGKV